jgi:hypothetical protein
MSQIKGHLLTPAIAAAAGTAIAVSVGIRQGWGAALISEFVLVCWVTILYTLRGNDTDTGAVLGQHADERQDLVGLKSARLSLAVVLGAVAAACVIAAAANYPVWPFEVLATIMGLAYFIGLRVYGVNPDASRAQEPGAYKYSLLGFRQDRVAD